ncbi:nuclear transport factor 2 family protein [Actinoplanes solisilvae]|uniref:nuclear transport factor 2 family protein n=1 Tax=Actinoplanes solisilvae TaxID=2486853 RepID=UPI00196B009A|nr:nuclear transport factor 2 family protein [Actinoplanes solisilvae]
MQSTHVLDLEQIRDLKARYCRLADTKQWDELATTLFTDDAVFRFFDVDGTLANEVTAAAFATTIGGRVAAGQPIHHVFSAEIAVDGDEATAVWAMEDRIFHDRQAHPEAPFSSMHGYGHYHERYRRIDGEWRIAGFDLTRLRLEIEL